MVNNNFSDNSITSIDEVEVRERFMSIISHELRTPLTTIYGYIQLLLKKNNLSDEEEKWLNRLYEETKRMTKLLDEFSEVRYSGQYRDFFKKQETEK